MGILSSLRGLKGSTLFSLGHYTHDVVTPDSKKLIEDAKQIVHDAKSVGKAVEENMKLVDALAQWYKTGIFELKEIKKAEGRYAMESGCETLDEEMDQKNRSDLVQIVKAEEVL